MGDNRVEVRFLEAQRAGTAGQAVVWFAGNPSLGGRWIHERNSVAESERPRNTGSPETRPA